MVVGVVQRHISMLTFLTNTYNGTVADRVRPYPIISFTPGLPESKRVPPFITLFASTDGRVVADGGLCRPSLALFRD